MPLTVNVGLSRKSSENYQSAGLSINITAELDQSLLADPPRLQDEIDRIYAQAEDALERQARPTKQTPKPAAAPRTTAANVRGGGRVSTHGTSGHGHANGTSVFPTPNPRTATGNANNGVSYGGPIRPATESQMRALRSLAKRLDCDLNDLMIETFGEVTVLTDIRMASQLIDILKARLEEAPTSNGRGRSRA